MRALRSASKAAVEAQALWARFRFTRPPAACCPGRPWGGARGTRRTCGWCAPAGAYSSAPCFAVMMAGWWSGSRLAGGDPATGTGTSGTCLAGGLSGHWRECAEAAGGARVAHPV